MEVIVEQVTATRACHLRVLVLRLRTSRWERVRLLDSISVRISKIRSRISGSSQISEDTSQ